MCDVRAVASVSEGTSMLTPLWLEGYISDFTHLTQWGPSLLEEEDGNVAPAILHPQENRPLATRPAIREVVYES